jgi:HAD superfamily hydrolase (TIGR01509 family)
MADNAVELLIFDCDGVLTDSERIAVKVDLQVLEELGLALSEADVITLFMGRSDQETRSEIEQRLGRALPADWQRQVDARYRAAFTAELKPVAGIVEALDRLTLRNCVASSGSHEHLRFTLGLTGLYDRFEGRIFSADDVAAGKPAPDVFLHAAAQMQVAPGHCLVVEDSVNGVRAARAAGMPALAYGGGLTPKQLLAGPDTVVFDDMRELPNVIERWCKT